MTNSDFRSCFEGGLIGQAASSNGSVHRESGSLVSRYVVTSLSNLRSLFNKNVYFMKYSRIFFTLVVISGKDQNSGYPKW